jgi:hypothetical protein
MSDFEENAKGGSKFLKLLGFITLISVIVYVVKLVMKVFKEEDSPYDSGDPASGV